MHLIWFRQDLRVSDHSALSQAVTAANDANQPLMALFIITPEQHKKHNESVVKLDFIIAHVVDLIGRLQHLNISSLVKIVPDYAAIPEVFESLIKDLSVKHIFWTKDYLINEQKRDFAVEQICHLQQVSVHTSEPHYLLPPQSISKQDGGMYHVFTPYKNNFLKVLQANYAGPLKAPEKINKPATVSTETEPLKSTWQNVLWPVGEQAAHQRIKSFLINSDYDKYRDYPAIEGSSRLSPYLAIGVITARQCLAHALKVQGESAFTSTWVSELIWRDFYHDLICWYPRLVKHQTFKAGAVDDWYYNPKIYSAWQTGQTGFPIIDAGMRQLQQQHWMHNRVRMLTASFLTKLCLHDWRLGERHFMEQLLDADFASNNGGWQWSSATGCDAAPYFRIFNPTTQSQKFDKNGDYIRQFVPELKDLSAKEIHCPNLAQRKACGYPEPIIEYKQARENALNWFKSGH